MLYTINYLLSPAIIYCLPTDLVLYQMKLSPDDYFPLAFLGMGGLIAGTYTLKTFHLFKPNIKMVEFEANLNIKVLQQWTIGGILFSLAAPFFPREIAFLIYLISLIRYVGAFGLMSINVSRYWPYTFGLLFMNFSRPFDMGCFMIL